MITLTKMQLRLRALNGRVSTEIFKDAWRYRLNIWIDGEYKGYLRYNSNRTRFVYVTELNCYYPEYTPTQFTMMVRNNLTYHPYN